MRQMNTLLIIAHGSSRQTSNDQIHAMVTDVRSRNSERYTRVECAFLEIASPNIPTAIDRLVGEGASKITLLPYFLTPGNHVVRDMPAILSESRRKHPNVEFDLRPHLGESPTLSELVFQLAHQASDETS